MIENSLLGYLMRWQKEFESDRQGVDGSLADYNNAEFILRRGVIGEAEEAIEALDTDNVEHQKEEAVDVLIFLTSLFNHLAMSEQELVDIARKKLASNERKYKKEYFEGRTVEDAILYSRQKHRGMKTATWVMRSGKLVAEWD